MSATNPNHPRLDPRLAERLQAKKSELDQYRPLPSRIVGRLYDDLRILITYHSNAIEGNSLSLRETQMVIENGLTVGGHPLKDYLEATNHAEAFNYLRQLAEGQTQINLTTILTLHGLVMQKIDERPGQFRNGQVYIRGATITPPPASQVVGLLQEWLAWVYGAGLAYTPLIRAAIAHHDFEAIHPFFDGNGRTGRLLLNLMLMQAGYPPALLLKDWRGGYIRALDTATLGDYSPIAGLVGRAVEGGLDLYLEACKKEPDELYQPLSTLATAVGYPVEYLSWLARHGRVEAIKRGRRWYSTLSAINRYKTEVANEVFSAGRPKKKPPTE